MKHTRKNKGRRPRRGSRAFDPACRNHGRCSWCRSNRTARNRRRIEVLEKLSG